MSTYPTTLLTYLPQDRRQALARGDALPQATEGAALFADISGFTALTEALTQQLGARRGIEALSLRINAVYEALIGEVERAQGSVIGFAGDAITCWFDQREPDAAARALHCAAGMQAAMPAFAGLALKVAIASGPAQRFAVGDPEVHLLDVLAGATLARVAAGEGLAQAGEVLVDFNTVKALALPTEPVRTTLAGDAFVVAQALPSTAVSPAPNRADATPFTEDFAQAVRPYVLPFVWARETAGQGLFATDLRPATALFVRFKGLDYDHDPAAPAALNALMAHAQQVCRRHGGVVLELAIGDKGSYFYAAFGAAQAHEDDARRALRAASALQAYFSATPYAVQMGLGTGTLRVGAYGSTTRRSFGAMGDEVNFAARLMVLAQPGEILISGRVRQAAATHYAVEARPPVHLKGKAEPMPVFALLGEDHKRALRLQEPAFSLPMVGREAEMAVLADKTTAALAGRGQVVGISAEAGMGKSRLIAEGIRLARRQGFVGYGGSCQVDGARTPYLVWQPIWQAVFDIDLSWPERKRLRWIESELKDFASPHAEAWPLLGAVLGLALPDNPFTEALPPKDRKALLEQVLLQCLASAAQEAAQEGGALLLVLEDLHAADPLSMDLLVQVARAIERLPVLVLLSYRPPAVEARSRPRPDTAALLGALPHFVGLALSGLQASQAESAVRAKLAQLFPEQVGPVPSGLIEHITERAQGNPFYVEELLSYLHDRGLDPRQPGALAAIELPPSLHSLVLSRIDRLPTSQQLSLKGAAIIGRWFRAADLQGYCPALGGNAEVQASLQGLDRQGFTPLQTPEPDLSYLFNHLITHEVSYQSMAQATRVQLHGLYARYLEQQGCERIALLAPELAHHYEAAEVADKASHYLRLAGEQAAARYANEEALAIFERALSHLNAGDAAARADVLLRCEALHMLLGQQPQRDQVLNELEKLLPSLPDAALLAMKCALARGHLSMALGNFTTARTHAQHAIDRASKEAKPTAGISQAVVDALSLQARAMFFDGEPLAAQPVLARALHQARAVGYRGGECKVLAQWGLLKWHASDHDGADATLLEAQGLIEASGDLRMELEVLNSLGLVARTRARMAKALAYYEQAHEIAKRIGDRAGQSVLLNNIGGVCLLNGDLAQAGQYATRAAATAAQANLQAQQGAALITLAEVHRELGQLPTALKVATQALTLLEANGIAMDQANVLENIGAIHFAMGQMIAAEESNAQCLRLAQRIGSHTSQAIALQQLARLHTAAGRFDVALQTLQQAGAMAEESGDDKVTLEVQAARTEAALGQAQWAEALAHAQAVLQALAPAHSGQAQSHLPMWMYEVTHRALKAAGHAEAETFLAHARAELQRRAERIADAATRQGFLGVAEHVALLSH